jgi:hypothetical protein
MNYWKLGFCAQLARALLLATVLLAVSLVGVSAQDATPSTSALAQNGLPELKLTVTDAGLQAPPDAGAGLTYVTLDNQTDAPMDATFFAQPEGVTLEQVAADLANPNVIPDWVYETAFIGGPVAPPGGTNAAVIDLSAGDWLIAQTNAETSSYAPVPVKVTGEAEAATSEAIPSDLKVTMKGYKFDFPDEVAAGPQVWEVTNDDPVPHFIVLLRYPGTVTEADVEALLASDSGTPPANLTIDPSKIEDAGFVPLHTQGKTSWIGMNLTPGTYIALCFMSDKGSMAPHAAMGMYDIFTVPGDAATPTS